MPRKKEGKKTSSPEIRFTITTKLNNLIVTLSEELGVDKSDYVRSLILTDLRNKRMKK